MELTALPIRLVYIEIMGRTHFGVWCQPLNTIVFSDESKEAAINFLTELRTLVDTGMSYGAALGLLYSTR
jgi:hypothetical protein